MKLNILSDLHLSCGALEMPCNDADVVILAGDIARPKEAVSWALGKPCTGTNVHVLDTRPNHR